MMWLTLIMGQTFHFLATVVKLKTRELKKYINLDTDHIPIAIATPDMS